MGVSSSRRLGLRIRPRARQRAAAACCLDYMDHVIKCESHGRVVIGCVRFGQCRRSYLALAYACRYGQASRASPAVTAFKPPVDGRGALCEGRLTLCFYDKDQDALSKSIAHIRDNFMTLEGQKKKQNLSDGSPGITATLLLLESSLRS